MDSVIIRSCTLNDIDSVLQLDAQWEQEQIAYNFVPISREAFVDILQRFPAYFLVAERDGQLVGYVNGLVQANSTLPVLPEHEIYLEIDNIYVQPDTRNADIGGELMRRLLEVAEQNGITRFIVGSVSKDMDKILRFYRSHGFTLWNIQLFK